MQITEALEVIGLNEKESAVYTALLQRGKASAYSVAQKSGLKKPTTYVILDELIKKGLVQKVPRAGKQMYAAKSPEEAFAEAEERLQIAKRKVPELLALTKKEGPKLNALYFEGLGGIKQLMEYRIKEMKHKEMLAFWASDSNVDPELVRYFREDEPKKMLQLGISVRSIAPEDESLKIYREIDAKYNRRTKTVPLNIYSSEIAIDVIGDLVRIQDYKNLQGMAIENPEIAKTMREIFEMIWVKY